MRSGWKSGWTVLVGMACAMVVLQVLAPSWASEGATDHGPAAAAVSEGGTEAAADHGAGGSSGGHSDPFSYVLLELGLIVLAASVGRLLAGRLRQPPVLGELLIGVIVGNVGHWLGFPLFTIIMNLGDVQHLIDLVWSTGQSVSQAAGTVFSPEKMAAGGSGYVVVKALTGSEAHTLVLMETALWMFSAFGVNLLLFMVGLESSIEEMVEAGGRSLMVAVVGVVTPFGLGWGACAWLLPGASTNVYLFISATLCATSVGITARVFKDLGRLQTPEAKIILGAAVIDDVLGLFVLAVVMGVVATGRADLVELGRIALFAALFLGITITFGERLVRLNLRLLRWIRFQGSKVLFPLSVGFVLAWLASEINLASIVGSFAAGLIMNERDFAQHAGEEEGSIRDLLRPLESIFAPIFFILMGMQVDLSSFADWEALGFAAVLTLAAVAGKVICGLPAGGKLDRLSIGLGMIPRGEVGLIFASMGKAMGIMTEAVFSAVVIMVIVTTLVTPLVLRWSLYRGGRGQVPA